MTPEQSPINIIPLSPNSNVNIPLGYVQNGVWSTCSKPCDSGIQYLPLICVDSSICKGKAMLQRICNIKACRKEVEDRLSSLKEVAEGHWESLGKWSECSKVCGGGVMTLQRRCVGNNCQGEATLTQPCNTLPCTILDPNKVQTMDVVFSVSKYDECRLLEGNLMMVVNNKKILSHMMVNVNEIMIYKKEKFTLKLDRIIVKDDNGEELEFKIKDSIGIYISEDNQKILSQTNDPALKLDVVKLALK